MTHALNEWATKKKELHTLGKFCDMALSESNDYKESDRNSIQQELVTFHSDDERPKKGPFESSDSESDRK